MFRNQPASTEFCLACGSLVDLPIYGDYVDCDRCSFKCHLTEYNISSIVTRKVYDEKKHWLQQYHKYINSGNYVQQLQQKPKKGKGQEIIEQKCMNLDCESNLCYFTAMQTRGADEGQTIFYQCVKCNERFKINA